VYVTGTFDDWSKSEKLVKTGDVFMKDVTLPRADEKFYYKVRGRTGVARSISIQLQAAHIHTLASGARVPAMQEAAKWLPTGCCF
jgi:hypothetical protein